MTASHDQEEQVEEKFELIVEEEGKEGEDVVFLILDKVGGKLLRRRSSDPNTSGFRFPSPAAEHAAPSAAPRKRMLVNECFSFLSF